MKISYHNIEHFFETSTKTYITGIIIRTQQVFIDNLFLISYNKPCRFKSDVYLQHVWFETEQYITLPTSTEGSEM